jgi:hypothetical protein
VWTCLQAAKTIETFATVEIGESGPATCFKLTHERLGSIDSIHLKEKSLHISYYLRIAKFLAFNRWIYRFKRTG